MPGGLISPNFVAIDPSGNIWIANTGNAGGDTNTVVEYNPTTQTYLSGTSGYSVTNPFAIAFDHAGNAWIASNVYRNDSLVELNSAGALIGTFTGGGLNSPQDVAIDGDGNVWLVGGVATGGGGLSEFSPSGTPIAPSGYSLGGANENQALAIDSSGNVWVSAFGGFGYGSCCSGGGFTESVGIAAPTVTPIAAAAANNTLGTEP